MKNQTSNDYKEETKKVYEKFTLKFAEKFAEYLPKYLLMEIEEFAKKIPGGGKILDIGSGSGDHALFLKNKGFDVFCIDISPEMIELCKEKGLKAKVMDLEKLQFQPKSFDAVWAYTSLLHIPKSNLNSVLKKIKETLKPNGIFFIGMKKGAGEGFVSENKYPGVKRWFSLFSDEELRDFLEVYFIIDSYSETKVDDDHVFLNYLCRSED